MSLIGVQRQPLTFVSPHDLGGITLSSGANNIDFASVSVVIDGRAYTIAADADVLVNTDGASGKPFIPLTSVKRSDGVVTLAERCGFVFHVDPDANFYVTQGARVPLNGAANDPQLVDALLGVQLPFAVPIAYAVFDFVNAGSNGTTATWTFGVDNWNASGVTFQKVDDIVTLPSRLPDITTAAIL